MRYTTITASLSLSHSCFHSAKPLNVDKYSFIHQKIGLNKVSVPKTYFKVVLDYQLPKVKMVGFIFPNEKCQGEPIDYIQSVDSIESITGLDFFPEIPDELENQLESEVKPNQWNELL